MIKGVIFDLDGVLADSNNLWVEAYRMIAKKVGIKKEFTNEEITKDFGDTYENVLKEIVGKEKLPEALKLLIEEIHSDRWISRLVQTKYSKQVVQSIRKRGIKVAVASGSDSELVGRSIRKLGLVGFFDIVLSADDVKKTKPAPDQINKILRYWEITPNEVIYVGDAKNDVLACRNAGVRVVVPLTGALSRESAKRVKPDWIIEDLSHLEKIIDYCQKR